LSYNELIARTPTAMNDLNSSPLPYLINTLLALLLGVLPAVVVGVGIGAILGQIKTVCQVSKRLLQIPASLPAVLLIPIALMLMPNAGSMLRPILVGFVAVWWVVMHVAIGVQSARQKGHWRWAIPTITLGIRFAIILAWSVVILIEMLKGQTGIGFYVWDVYNQSAADSLKIIVNATIAVTFTVFLLDQAVDLIGMALMQFLKSKEDLEERSLDSEP
jgi:ABC-type nitrate/sulfonate/bicarbonate transport system permease component